MALAIDASTPTKTTVAINTSSTTTASFSPVANSIIVLCCAINGAGNATQSITSVTDNLTSHLSWKLLIRDNITSISMGGCAEIWYAPCPSAQSGMTITTNYGITSGGSGASAGIIKPIVFTGASMNQSGATTKNNNTAATTPSLSLSTQFDNSWVIGSLLNFTNATGPTAGANQTNTINSDSSIILNVTSGDSWWVQIQNAATTAQRTSVTINDTAPTSVSIQFCVCEIMAQQPLFTNYQFLKAGDGMSVSEKIR